MEYSAKQIRFTLAIVMVASFITPFMSNAINLAIPSIGEEFGGSQSWLNWVVSGFLIPYAAFLLPFGHLADRYGRRRIFLLGTIIIALSALGCALAPSLPVLVAFRVVSGISSAMVFSNTPAILTSVVPPGSRGKMLGLNSAATYVGLSAGPVLGGLIAGVSWRGIFWFNFLLALIVVVLTVWKLTGEWKGSSGKTDGLGSVLCVAAQALMLFGLGSLSKGPGYLVSFLAGAVLIAAFVWYENRRADALIPVRYIVRNRPFLFSNFANLINYSAVFALSYVLSLYLQTALGIDSAASGLILLIEPALMAILSPVTGALSDKVRPTVLAAVGMGLSALGLFFFIFLGVRTPVALIIANLGIIGLGFALFATPNTNAIMGSVDRSLYGLGSSMMGNMRLLGQSISMAIVSLITTAFIGDAPLGSEAYIAKFMVSLRTCFIVFTVLCSLGVVMCLLGTRAARAGAQELAAEE
ncbi:MAG: MFS transporter [Clostridiales bacterium]|nr:MFS transporter [Clostridiales bacterium]